MGTYNLKDTADKANTFDALPEDRYSVVVEEAVVAPTKAGGEMIKITFLVEDGKYKGRKLWHQFPLSEKANIFLVNFLKVVNPGLIKNGVTPQEITAGLKGTHLTAWAEPSTTQNGNPTNKLGKFQGTGTVAGDAPVANAPKKALFA
jgi:hypothetical protein